MSQDELIQLAMKKIDKEFPLSDRHRDVYLSDRDNNFYFSALWHMRDYLITPKIIAHLKSGAKMLSIGSGDGHLERLLARGFAVPRKNIHVSDISIHPKLLNQGFPRYEFDLTQDWPKLPCSFDYVIFPESLGVALLKLRLEGNCVTSRFYEDTVKIVNATLRKRNVSGADRDFYIGLIERDIPQAIPTYNILRQAYDLLNNDGELRVSRGGGIKYEQMNAYVGLKFKKEFPKSKYDFSVTGPSIIQKK